MIKESSEIKKEEDNDDSDTHTEKEGSHILGKRDSSEKIENIEEKDKENEI